MNESNEIHEVAVIDDNDKIERFPAPATVNPLDLPTETFRANLERRKANRSSLMAWVKESLVEGTDYGKIHVVSKTKCQSGSRCTNPYHFSKDILFKPGAEKICGMLGVTPTFPNLPAYEQMALNGGSISTIILRCEMVNTTGTVIATGVGARDVQKNDYGDLNKAFKMAEKSAQIDATLRMGGLSEVFTQDLDQMAQDAEMQSSTASQQTEASFDRKKVFKWVNTQIATREGVDREQFKEWLLQGDKISVVAETGKASMTTISDETLKNMRKLNWDKDVWPRFAKWQEAEKLKDDIGDAFGAIDTDYVQLCSEIVDSLSEKEDTVRDTLLVKFGINPNGPWPADISNLEMAKVKALHKEAMVDTTNV